MPRVVAAPPATYPYRRQAHWSLTTYAALSVDVTLARRIDPGQAGDEYRDE